MQTAEPDASAREQALAVLPFAVQDLVGFDEIAETFATGDLATLATRIDTGESGETGQGGALDGGRRRRADRSVANLVSERIPEGELRDEFLAGYAAGVRVIFANLGAIRLWARFVSDSETICAQLEESVRREVVGGVGEPGEATGLAAQDVAPELVGLAGEQVVRVGVEHRARRRPRSRPRAGRGPSRSSRGTRAAR